MLVRLAIHKSPHVEVGSGIGLAGIPRIGPGADGGHTDDVFALSGHRDDLGFPVLGIRGNGLRRGLGKRFHDDFAAGTEGRVVLNVLFGQVLGRIVPVAVSKQIDHDMHGRLLVGVQGLVFILKQRRGIDGTGNGDRLAKQVRGGYQNTDEGKS